MIDKTSVIGISGTSLTVICQNLLPVVSLLTGIVTLVYMLIKIVDLVKTMRKEK